MKSTTPPGDDVAQRRGETELATEAVQQGEPILVVDRGWRVLLANQRLESLAGVAREELLGQVVWEALPELAGAEGTYRRKCAQAIDARQPIFFEQYYSSWQRWLDVSVYPSDTGALMFFRDISDKKRAQRAVFERALDAVVGMDGEGAVTDWNRQAESTFGWSREEALGRLMAELIIPENLREAHDRGLKRYLETGEGPILNQRIEVTALHRSGKEFPVELTVTPLSAQGNPVFYAFLRDISESKAITAEREAVVKRLERALSLNETFFSVLAHDLRTPLSAIRMNTELMRRQGAKLSPQRAGERIAASAERMGRMIEQLLDVSRARVGGGIPIERQAIDLERVCREGVTEVMSANPACIVELEVAGDCTGDWDPDRLGQVVSNLVGNAVHHSTEGSQVDVLLDGTADDVVEFTVRNQGVIPAELLPVLFEPFEYFSRRPRRQRGLGLGLYITREIVRGHGGEVEVRRSEKEGTTTFVVSLPRT